MKPSPTHMSSLEQGQTNRGQAASQVEARLVDPDEAPGGGAKRDLAIFNLAIDSKYGVAMSSPSRSRMLLPMATLSIARPYVRERPDDQFGSN